MTVPAVAARPLVAPVFLPHAGCPHRCVFCNQSTISGVATPEIRLERIGRQVASFLRRARSRSTVQIAYYGGNFLGQHPASVRRLLQIADAFVSCKKAHGIRFSTRPDTIDDRSLDAVAPFPVDTVEIGAQSLDDDVLDRCRRGHTSADTAAAVACLKNRGYRIGLQLMIGLPGQSRQSCLATAERAAALGPDFVRIYPALVLAGTPLARWYRRGRFSPLSLDAAVSLAAEMLCVFSRHGIPAVRLGLQTTEDLQPGSRMLAGPSHPAFGELVRSAAWLARIQDGLGAHRPIENLAIWVHPRAESQLRGQHGRNLALLRDRFRPTTLAVCKNEDLDPETIRIEVDGKRRDIVFGVGAVAGGR